MALSLMTTKWIYLYAKVKGEIYMPYIGISLVRGSGCFYNGNYFYFIFFLLVVVRYFIEVNSGGGGGWNIFFLLVGALK
jgi:hypothetical protein